MLPRQVPRGAGEGEGGRAGGGGGNAVCVYHNLKWVVSQLVSELVRLVGMYCTFRCVGTDW